MTRLSVIRKRGPFTIKRLCYFPKKRSRVWWWKLLDREGEIAADGFSSKIEAREYARQHKLELAR